MADVSTNDYDLPNKNILTYNYIHFHGETMHSRWDTGDIVGVDIGAGDIVGVDIGTQVT